MSDDDVPRWKIGDEDWPKSEFAGQKVVLLFEDGSVVYSWLGKGIDEVLESPTPPELITRKGLSEESLKEMLSFHPEIGERFIDAMDHGISSGTLLEGVIGERTFNLEEAIYTEIDPEINEDSEEE